MRQQEFNGTGVAMIAPFRKDGSINFNILGKLTEHLISNKVNFLVVHGTTGEAPTLSSNEKEAITNFVIEYTNKSLPIVVGIGGNNTQEVVNNIKNQDFSGIDGILSVVPYYNKPSQRGLYQHYKTIAYTSPVPVIAYNIPGRTGVNMTADTCLKIAHEIDNIIAVKEASGDLNQIMRIIKDKPDNFSVLSGDDSLTLPILSLGGNGAISVIANAFPFQFTEMVSNALKGHLKSARNIHFKLIDIMEAIFIEGNPAGIKAALDVLELAPNNLRLPLTPVSRSTYNLIAKLISEINF
ncbi:4-hydroxy-tetrahydrodipicolinate synthase [Bacteroidota bacterium]